jgi:hypothetical protein
MVGGVPLSGKFAHDIDVNLSKQRTSGSLT